VVDATTDEILMVNNYYTKMLGVARERMEGRRCWEFVMGSDGKACRDCPRSAEDKETSITDALPNTIEAFNPTLGIWVRGIGQAIEWVDGRRAHIITAIDTSNEKMLREELSHLAYFDRALDIPNRIRLERDLGERPEGNYCIIAYDIISMRYLNDAYGRTIIDAFMREIVRWIMDFRLQNFQIYRIDGDSFAILFDYADMMSASGLADRIFERFLEPWRIRAQGETVSFSCKVSLCVLDGRMNLGDPESILSHIERTLVVSKETGSVAVYDKTLDDILRREHALEISLKNCIADNMKGFEVYFQPIVSATDGVWKGVEALCRWDSPEFGRIPPLVFIRMAEQIGLINAIGYWVLDQALRVCSEFELHQRDGFFLDVNLAPSQMSDESLIAKIIVALQKYSYPGNSLILEVTESEEVDATEYSSVIIERLRALDIRLALDDFGTGYSNFNNLKRMPVSYLKTEKQFIDNIVTDGYQQYLSSILVQLSHMADMKLIAEGVETVEQLREVMKNGTDFFQGYLFSVPLKKEELKANIDYFNKVDPFFAQVHNEYRQKTPEEQEGNTK
jgi:EAL domain-containing protein (putative c-di-GMP-specific phosphodiesterase class I)/GGDEF domain-containing protein